MYKIFFFFYLYIRTWVYINKIVVILLEGHKNFSEIFSFIFSFHSLWKLFFILNKELQYLHV